MRLGDLLGDLYVALDEERGVSPFLTLTVRIGQRRGGQAADEPAPEGALLVAATRSRMIQLPSSVPQSSSRVMTSWATSTRRRVR